MVELGEFQSEDFLAPWHRVLSFFRCFRFFWFGPRVCFCFFCFVLFGFLVLHGIFEYDLVFLVVLESILVCVCVFCFLERGGGVCKAC